MFTFGGGRVLALRRTWMLGDIKIIFSKKHFKIVKLFIYIFPYQDCEFSSTAVSSKSWSDYGI